MNTTTLKVLVVDDEPGMCLGAKRALHDYRTVFEEIDEDVVFVIESVETGKALIDRIPEMHPDILLLDCKLPDIDGMEILNRIKHENINMATIIMTAYATLETAVKSTRLGAYDFLAKPFTPEELRYSIRKAAHSVILTRKTRRLDQERKQVRFEFISVLAHELKSPLNAVETYVDIIRNRRGGNSLDDYSASLDRMALRLDGMRKLITDILDLTRIESGKRSRTLSEVDIASLCREVMDMETVQAETRGITMKMNGDSPLMLRADPGEIQIVLSNLISNAVKYNVEKGNIDIRLADMTNHVVISVTDTGIGIAEKDTNRLFKEFSRIKSNATRDIQGSGLGLAIVQKISSLYGGTVTIESQPGLGSTFTVKLKRQSNTPQEA